MFLSILISLVSSSSAPILGPLGRPANAWFLRQLTRHRPELAQALHNDSGVKPYTVSTLLDGRGRPLQAGRWLQPGESCWLRLTTYDPQLSEVVLHQILPQLPGHLEIYKMRFNLEGWTLDPAQHPWARRSSFQELAQQKEQNLPREVGLEFASPTAFRTDGADLPLPIPGQVFRGLGEKWNALAPEAMSINPIWPKFAAACIVVSEISGLNTDRWEFAEGTRGVATGFTGYVRFSLLPKHARPKMAEYWDGADIVMHTLSQFAFYCGTGHHTTIGLGQTRPLPPRADPWHSAHPLFLSSQVRWSIHMPSGI